MPGSLRATAQAAASRRSAVCGMSCEAHACIGGNTFRWLAAEESTVHLQLEEGTPVSNLPAAGLSCASLGGAGRPGHAC